MRRLTGQGIEVGIEGKRSVSNCCRARKRKKARSQEVRDGDVANGSRAMTDTWLLAMLYADLTSGNEDSVNQEVVILRLESGKQDC